MKKFVANLVVCFWAALFGEVIGFLASQLQQLEYNFLEIGFVTLVCLLLIVNGFSLVMKNEK